MIKHPSFKFLILILIVATFTLTGCGTDDASIATDPAGLADDEVIPLDTICDLTDEMDGKLVEISGEVAGIAEHLNLEEIYLHTGLNEEWYPKLGWRVVDRDPVPGRKFVIMRKRTAG